MKTGGSVAWWLSISPIEHFQEQLRRHAAEIEAANNQLVATNIELKDFANIIAHDFRTPMVNLKGFTRELGYSLAELKQIIHYEALDLPAKIQAKVDELVDKDVPDAQRFIDSAADRLSRMVDALLKLARLGRRDMSYTQVDMDKLVDSLLRSYQHQIDEKNIQVEVGPLPKIETDLVAMEQIVGNLLDNAIKY